MVLIYYYKHSSCNVRYYHIYDLRSVYKMPNSTGFLERFSVSLKFAMKIIHCEDPGLVLAFIFNIFINLFGDHFTHCNMEIAMPAHLDHSGLLRLLTYMSELLGIPYL